MMSALLMGLFVLIFLKHGHQATAGRNHPGGVRACSRRRDRQQRSGGHKCTFNGSEGLGVPKVQTLALKELNIKDEMGTRNEVGESWRASDRLGTLPRSRGYESE